MENSERSDFWHVSHILVVRVLSSDVDSSDSVFLRETHPAEPCALEVQLWTHEILSDHVSAVSYLVTSSTSVSLGTRLLQNRDHVHRPWLIRGVSI